MRIIIFLTLILGLCVAFAASGADRCTKMKGHGTITDYQEAPCLVDTDYDFCFVSEMHGKFKGSMVRSAVACSKCGDPHDNMKRSRNEGKQTRPINWGTCKELVVLRAKRDSWNKESSSAVGEEPSKGALRFARTKPELASTEMEEIQRKDGP